jgi:hypothetical protein
MKDGYLLQVASRHPEVLLDIAGEVIKEEYEDLQVALARLHNINEPAISGEGLKKSLGM